MSAGAAGTSACATRAAAYYPELRGVTYAPTCSTRLFPVALSRLGAGPRHHHGARNGPSDAVIAGASVTVTNQDTGIKITTSTNEAGNYVVRGLAFGSYEIVCEAKGFRKYLGKDNKLDIAQTLTLDSCSR